MMLITLKNILNFFIIRESEYPVIRTPDSPYFKNPKQFLKYIRKKTQKPGWYIKPYKKTKNTDYNTHPSYGLVSNKFLKEKYLSKVKLTAQEIKELGYYIEIRRKFIEKTGNGGHYHFTRAFHEYNYELAFNKAKKNSPKKWLLWKAFRNKIYWYQYGGRNRWENFKDRMGYFSQADMLAYCDFAAIKKDMKENRDHELSQTWNLDRIEGKLAYRVLPLDKKFLHQKVVQRPLNNLIKRMKRYYYENRLHAQEPHWLYHDPYNGRTHFKFKPLDYLYEHSRFNHIHRLYFRRESKAVLFALQKWKKVKRHEKRVKKHWDWVLNKKVPFKHKVKAFFNGDLWLQSSFDFIKWFNFDWGSGKYASKQKYKQYENARLAAKFNENNGKNAFQRFFKKYHYKRYWSWGHPRYFGNINFLAEYFRPYVYKKIKHPSIKLIVKDKKNFYSSTAEHPDIFWFKYSHRDFLFLRRADRSLVDPKKFHSGAYFRYFHKKNFKLWLAYFKSAPTKRHRSLFFNDWKNYGNIPVMRYYKSLKIPKPLIPDVLWTHYYTYVGPNYWYRLKEHFDELPYFFGPGHLPTNISYSCFFEDFSIREYEILLYHLWMVGLSKKLLIVFNAKFLSLIFFFSIINYFIFFFYASRAPLKPVRWSFCIKEPIYVTRKFEGRDEWITQIEDFKLNKLARLRHRLNWWVLIQIIPFLIIAWFLPFWFIKAHTFVFFVNWKAWLISLGSFCFCNWLRIGFLWTIVSIMNWAESKVSAREFQEAWAKERALTHAAERKYLRKKAEYQKKAGVSYDKDHLTLPK